MKMVGIFGGTFDPVHFGHLNPALDVKHALALDEIRFIPNQDPPHREKPWLSVEQRKQLLELALSECDGCMLDTRELDRPGKSFMVDTLASLHDEFPEAHLCLILGMDALAGFKNWHRWETILSLCHLVVTHRPGYRWEEMPDVQWFEQFLVDDVADLKREAAGRILLQSVTQVDVSASQIRQRINDNQDISHLMPERTHQLLMKMIEQGMIEAADDCR